jgi:hypothetical protein
MPLTNTLETARRIEALGFTHQQAQGFAELFETTAQDARKELVTRADLEVTRADLERLIAEVRMEIAGLRADFRDELRKQMLWFFSVQIALLGIAVAIIKLFPNAH